MTKKFFILCVLFFLSNVLYSQQTTHSFRVRTVTAGITLNSLTDTATFNTAIEFLKKAKQAYIDKGYEVQTLRISTQNFYKYLEQYSYNDALPFLVRLDKIAQRNSISLAIGQVLLPDTYQAGIGTWAQKLVQTTSNISFSLAISSHETGIHFNSIKASSEIVTAISGSKGGEACFRFTASANCPAGIPFFPAAFHEGVNSFAVGLESANLITQAFKQNNNPLNARQSLKSHLEKNLIPIQDIAENISKTLHWQYDGIDASPAPGLDASIGQAIETYTKQPFGSAATLSACALITDVLKGLNIKKCGYSGLMLPVIEDTVLAKRAMEKRFTIQELLLFSSVSGTGLDVVPIPGNTSKQVIENIFTDVAALSLKYTAKALSVRLFLIPGKKTGDIVKFENPYLTSSVVMKAD
ncbi:MAG: hypothetical protein JWN83_1906 [Chitinophagaceae bacterium]|nr:hypothetical protein [Chitinophagaceae bacterium]